VQTGVEWNVYMGLNKTSQPSSKNTSFYPSVEIHCSVIIYRRWVDGKSVSVLEPKTVAEDCLNPLSLSFHLFVQQTIELLKVVCRYLRSILISSGERFRRQEVPSWSTFSGGSEVDIRWYDLTLTKLWCVHRLVPDALTAEVSNMYSSYKFGVPFAKFPDKKKEFLFSNATAVEFDFKSSHRWPTTPITTNWFDVRWREESWI
jgi:hypothetical protein